MKDKKSILITGASGFIGQYCTPLLEQKYNVTTVSLRSQKLENIDLEGIDVILYLSGIAHQSKGTPAELYFNVNRDFPIMLAEKAKQQKVEQFIYLSSVKVYGDNKGSYFDLNSTPHPTDPYGDSKWQAEQALSDLGEKDFCISIIRPPLVYGPNVKGNLQKLIDLLNSRRFLPFKGIKNKRSMVFIGNLHHLIATIIEGRHAGTFIAGDKQTHSTTELINAISIALKSDTRLFKIPIALKKIVKWIRPSIYDRLFSDFVIDNGYTNEKLNFVPPYSFQDGINEMCNIHMDNE